MNNLGKPKNITAFAEQMGVTPATIHSWIKKGNAPVGTRINGRTYFLAKDVEEWLAAQPKVGA